MYDSTAKCKATDRKMFPGEVDRIEMAFSFPRIFIRSGILLLVTMRILSFLLPIRFYLEISTLRSRNTALVVNKTDNNMTVAFVTIISTHTPPSG